jgi:hypothetical protein
LIRNKEELLHQWKESIVVPIYKKGDKTDCSNYQGISLLSTSYKILSNILLTRLTPHADEIIGGHHCEFRRNRSTTDQIFYIRQILEKKMGYNDTVHQLFIDFKKAYDSVRREVLYSILIEFGIPRKLVGLIKTCLNETYSTVHIHKYQSDKFPIQNGLKQGDEVLSNTALFSYMLGLCFIHPFTIQKRFQVFQENMYIYSFYSFPKQMVLVVLKTSHRKTYGKGKNVNQFPHFMVFTIYMYVPLISDEVFSGDH